MRSAAWWWKELTASAGAAGEPVQQRAVADVDGVRRRERLVALEMREVAAVREVLVQRPAAGRR